MMNEKILITKFDSITQLCAVCVTDRPGAKTALLIILLSFFALFIANWAWKKYFKKNKEQL